MNTQESLLFTIAEECAEVAQRASKAARFGLDEIQPGQLDTNAERLMQEFDDLCAVIQMLQEASVHLPPSDSAQIAAKKLKVQKYLAYSRECGTLSGD